MTEDTKASMVLALSVKCFSRAASCLMIRSRSAFSSSASRRMAARRRREYREHLVRGRRLSSRAGSIRRRSLAGCAIGVSPGDY